MIYKNTTRRTYNLYGVEFKPNDVHNVPGHINIPGFIKVDNIKVESPNVIQAVLEPTIVESMTASVESESLIDTNNIVEEIEIKPIKTSRRRNSSTRKTNIVAEIKLESEPTLDNFNMESQDVAISESDDIPAINSEFIMEETVDGKDYN